MILTDVIKSRPDEVRRSPEFQTKLILGLASVFILSVYYGMVRIQLKKTPPNDLAKQQYQYLRESYCQAVLEL